MEIEEEEEEEEKEKKVHYYTLDQKRAMSSNIQTKNTVIH
jgi:hypothetical protein